LGVYSPHNTCENTHSNTNSNTHANTHSNRVLVTQHSSSKPKYTPHMQIINNGITGSEVFNKKQKTRSLAVFENVNSILGDSKLSDQELIKTNPLFYNMNKNIPVNYSKNLTVDQAQLLEVAKLAFPKEIKEKDVLRKNIIKKIFGKVKNPDGDIFVNSLYNLKIDGLRISDLVKKGKDTLLTLLIFHYVLYNIINIPKITFK